MLKFIKLNEEVNFLRPYFEKSRVQFCDLSVGVRFMWRNDFIVEYAVFNDTLILKESCLDYTNAFYFPIGEDVFGALSEIEEYCKINGLPLQFCCQDDNTSKILLERYPFSDVSFDRNWSDYIYDADAFKTYSGKKLSGQRNHVNKFKKTYPNYIFREITDKDIDKIYEFLDNFTEETVFNTWTAIEEQKAVKEFVKAGFSLNQFGGVIEVDNKIIALSMGEKVQNTLIVHIEKGLKEYEGVYPTMAQEFAKRFATNEITLINREEDCGDLGLRTSKLQYHPLTVKQKNFIKVNTLFDRLKDINLSVNDLKICDIEEKDKENYAKLYLDDNLNKYYGYDYREDLNGKIPNADYFYVFMNNLKEKKEEYSFAVKKDDCLIGEIVLYNFTIYGEVEIGFRFFNEFQHKGYAFITVNAIIELLKTMGVKTIKARAFKENLPSIKLLNKLRFQAVNDNKTHNFYELK